MACKSGKPSDQCSVSQSLSEPTVKVTHKKVNKKNGRKQDLKIQVQIGKGNLVTENNLEDGVVIARFPDNSVCEFDPTGKTRKFYKYLLELRKRNDVYQEKKGFCELGDIPGYNGQPVIIEFDDDDEVGTPNTEIARINFQS
jgi:hypothetical protein